MAWTYGLDGLRKGGKHPAYSLPKSVTLFSVGLSISKVLARRITNRATGVYLLFA